MARPGAGVEIDGGVGAATIADCARAGEPLHRRLRDLLRADPPPRITTSSSACAPRGRPRGLTAADARTSIARWQLAKRGARTAAPNPLVGCVLVRDGAVVGEGFHVRPGTAHAEVVALAAAGAAAQARPPTSASSPARTPAARRPAPTR